MPPWEIHRKILVVHTFFLSQWIFLKFCTEHGIHTVVLCAKFQKNWSTNMDVTDKRDSVIFQLKTGFGCYRPQVSNGPNHGKLTFIGFCLGWHRETMGDPLVMYHTVHITIDRTMPQASFCVCAQPMRDDVIKYVTTGWAHAQSEHWCLNKMADMSHTTFQIHFVERKPKWFDLCLIDFLSQCTNLLHGNIDLGNGSVSHRCKLITWINCDQLYGAYMDHQALTCPALYW